MTKWIVSLTAAMLATVGAVAGEPHPWPQFRGPGGSGVADNEKPPVEIGPDKNVKWKVPVPSGLSSPIIVGDKLVLTAFDDGKLFTIAYDRTDGSEVWRAHAPVSQLEKFHKVEGSPAASTPTTDGERIISYFGSCGIFCYDLAGHEKWKHEMPPAVTMAGFGTGVSPLLADNTVVLLRDETTDPKIIALNAESGDVIWEKKRKSNSTFSTPTIWKTPAGTQVVAPGFGKMIGYDLRTGNEQWFVDGMPSACCTTPVTANGHLFFAGWSPGDPSDKESQMPSFDEFLKERDANGDGVLTKDEFEESDRDFFDNLDADKDGTYSREESEQIARFMAATVNSAFALRAGGTGDVTKTHMLWKQTRGLPYVSSAIVYRGQYVMVKDGGIVTAYDATSGEELYSKRPAEAGTYYASPVAANGNIYFITLLDGAVTVLRAGVDKPEVVAKNPPLGERTAATPAIADDTLYIRTADHLYAFSVED
jgi:outer membrane protein assembly factor BamB